MSETVRTDFISAEKRGVREGKRREENSKKKRKEPHWLQ